VQYVLHPRAPTPKKAKAGFMSVAFKLIGLALLEVLAALLETSLGLARTLLTYIPLLFLFFFSVVIWYTVSSYNVNIVFTVDALYESLRPTIVELLLQVLNFTRVIFALVVGVWNTVIEILLVPVRVLFEAGFECASTTFVQDIALKGSAIATEAASVLSEFADTFADTNTLSVNITTLSFKTRDFLRTFADILTCSCDTISPLMVQTVAAPLYTQMTDVYANSAARVGMKLLEIPYRAASTGDTSFEPLFDALLDEETGYLASGAAILNEQLRVVVELVQSPVDEQFRFGSPPLFSVGHRNSALMLIALRTCIRVIGVLPLLLKSSSRQAADTAYESLSIRDMVFHAERLNEVSTVEIPSSVHSFLRPPAEVVSALFKIQINVGELLYNTTMSVVTGVATLEHVSGSGDLCGVQIRHSDDAASRFRHSAALFSKKWSERIVPLQISWADKARSVTIRRMQIPGAETTYSLVLALIKAVEGGINMFAYTSDAVVRGRDVRHDCMSGFTRRAFEQALDTLDTLPYGNTQILALQDTIESGYPAISCARTTYVNHIYSGSLKRYVYASSACDTVYAESGEMPTCSYRNENFDTQNFMCRRLVAHADFNSIPRCNIEEASVAIYKNLIQTQRAVVEYHIGMYVAVWNCMNDPATLKGFLGCASSISKELIPPNTLYDLLECQAAEASFRASTIAMSYYTPIFAAVYMFTGYPDDGYFAKGADDIEHVQAKPLEAALASMVTAFSIPYWTVHMSSHLGRTFVSILEDLQSNPTDIGQAFVKFQSYRYEVQRTVFRVQIIQTRDMLVSVLQFVRVVSTIVEYYENKGDPRLPNPIFMDIQEEVMDLVSLIQNFAELLSDVLFEGIEAFFECVFLLIRGLVMAKPDSIRLFFTTVVEQLATTFMQLLNGFMGILFEDDSSPLKIVCNIATSMKDGLCNMMSMDFIPSGMSIGCGTSDTCSWWPLNGKGFGESAESATSTVIPVDNNPITTPQKVKRRRLLWGPVGNEIEGGFEDLGEGIQDGVEYLADGTVKIALKSASMIEDSAEWVKQIAVEAYEAAVKFLNSLSLDALLNEVEKEVIRPVMNVLGDTVNVVKVVANKAKKGVNSAVGTFTDIANKVATLPQTIWNSVYSIIPTKFAMSTTDMFGLTGTNRDDMQCGQALCSDPDKSNTCDASQEATVCSKDRDCDKPSSYCVTADQDLCGTDDAEINSNACISSSTWAKACGCKSLKYGTLNHCNYATGFCTAGDSPFVAPLTECSTSDQLVYGADDYNKLCYISPIWKCANFDDKLACRSVLANDKLEGPSLCRAFCEPTFMNRNNRLTQYNYHSGETKCVCEVGFDRAFPNQNQTVNLYPTTTVETVNIMPKAESTTRRRRLLTRGKYAGASRSVFTSCNTNAQCAPSFSNPTICKSLWTLPITCYSCSERVHGASFSLGYQCNAQSKTCECTAPVSVDPEDERDRPDDVDWRGDSWCDKIMRGYRYQAVRSPLENMWVHKCARLREFGIGLTGWLGLQSVPPDVVYNPQRTLSIVADMIHASKIYFGEGWAERDDEDGDLERLFDRLVRANVDPILAFKLLDAGQKIMGIGRAVLAQFDFSESIAWTLDSLAPEASIKFRMGVKATSNVTNAIRSAGSSINMVATFQALEATAVPLQKFVHVVRNATALLANKTKVSSSTKMWTPAIDVQPVSLVSNVEMSSNTRALLTSFKECQLLSNAKSRLVDAVNSLTEYYGTEGKYLGASLCSYEQFLKGSLDSGCSDSTTNVSFPHKLPEDLNFGTLQHIKMSDLTPDGITQLIDKQLAKPREDIFRQIIKATANVQSKGVRCDSDVLMCKKQTRSLLEAVVIAQMYVMLALAAFFLLGINIISISLFITSQLLVVPPLTLYLAYGVLPSCYPRIPVCIADDAFALLTFFLPRHIAWSEHIVSNVERIPFDEFVWFTQLSADVVNCQEHGFTGLYDVFFWAREASRGYGYELPWYIAEWPLLRFAPGAYTSSRGWRTREVTDTARACGTLIIVGIIPPLLISFLCYLTLSFALGLSVRVASKVVKKTLPWVQLICIMLLDLYNI
jgi:hypothetical protein